MNRSPASSGRRSGHVARARGRASSAVGLAVALVLAVQPAAFAASDVFSNVAPASQLPSGSLINAHPLGHYTLDHHFPAVDAGVLSGVDVSGIAPTIAWFLANLLWTLTAFLAHAVITLFSFAFSLDLVGGSTATGGAGALEPVSAAVRSIYGSTFGQPWLIVAVLITGLWAIWNALVRRRYTETAGALALSVIYVVIALALVTQPERTIGQASRWSNQMSGAFLSLSSQGSVGDLEQAKRNAADRLFDLLVYQPWVVLQFGGLEHCVRDRADRDPVSVAVRPLARDRARDAELARGLATGTQVEADGKTCINNRNKYAPRFLEHAPGSDERREHYEALRDGDASKAPEPDRAGYQLSAADRPAADAIGKDGQYQRLLLAIVIFAGQLGALALLGALSVAVILAQVLVLLLLAFAPVALVVAVLPGRGHDFFIGWLSRLATFLLRKAIYSLILSVLLTVAGALAEATSNLGWLMAFGLQGVFFWAVLLYRRQLTGQLTQATTGHPSDKHDAAIRLASLHAASRTAQRLHPARHHSAHPRPDGPDRAPDPPPPTPPSPQSDGDRTRSPADADALIALASHAAGGDDNARRPSATARSEHQADASHRQPSPPPPTEPATAAPQSTGPQSPGPTPGPPPAAPTSRDGSPDGDPADPTDGAGSRDAPTRNPRGPARVNTQTARGDAAPDTSDPAASGESPLRRSLREDDRRLHEPPPPPPALGRPVDPPDTERATSEQPQEDQQP